MLLFAAFVLLPLLYAVYLSFTRFNGVVDPVWVGLSNYESAWGDSAWWNSVRNTFILAFGGMAIEIPLSLFLAVLLNRALKLGGFFRTVYFVPHVISIAVMGVVFYFLLRPVDGVINGLLSPIGIVAADMDWLGSRPTALLSLILVGVWASFGVNTILFLVGMQTISRDIYEAARIDGAGSWKMFSRITVPLLSPILRIVVMLSIIFSMRSFDLVKTLTDGAPAGQTEVMFTYLFGYYFGLDHGAQYGYASALAVYAAIIVAILSVIYLYLSRSKDGGSR